MASQWDECFCGHQREQHDSLDQRCDAPGCTCDEFTLELEAVAG